MDAWLFHTFNFTYHALWQWKFISFVCAWRSLQNSFENYQLGCRWKNLRKGNREKFLKRMRAGKTESEAEAEEISSTTISNIKLYNLVRDSLKSNAFAPFSAFLIVIHLRIPREAPGEEVDFKINYLLLPLTFLSMNDVKTKVESGGFLNWNFMQHLMWLSLLISPIKRNYVNLLNQFEDESSKEIGKMRRHKMRDQNIVRDSWVEHKSRLQ